MGLAHRVIVTMLVKGTTLVKGRRFSADRVVGHAAQAIKVQQARGVDELVMLDVTATKERRGPDLSLVENLSEELRSPFAVGGGISSLEDVRNVLRAGADKVVICSAWLRKPELLRQISGIVGKQALVASIDVGEDGCVYAESGSICAYTDPSACAWRAADFGAGEILLTSIEREGTMSGYDLDLISSVSDAVSVPVIAHGGCRDYEDMAAAISCGASAVAAGALFQFTDATPKEAAQYLAALGIEARV